MLPLLCRMKNKDCKNMEKNGIARLEEKQKQLIELLKEYKKVVENENKLFHLFPDEEVNRIENWSDSYKCEYGKGRVNRLLYQVPEHRYYLVDRNTKKVVCYGSKQRLKSFMRIRKIEMEQVLIDADRFDW